jgi:hypothetical protein
VDNLKPNVLHGGAYGAASNVMIRGYSSSSQSNSTSTEIEFEKIKVESTILVRFELK